MEEDEIAQQIELARKSGELQQAASFGKPLADDDAFTQTPDALRMPFKILKDAGCVPPEVDALRSRSALQAALAAAQDPAEQRALQQRLSELDQAIALRLESLRSSGVL
ncbi:DnaJ family domain-containing protein [Chitinimonas sp.]|uniref:DnaJ family domain-containing protein n=1 Tax=Chitinimonas sp. TaxID=1934313 RepID=UPI0035B4809D